MWQRTACEQHAHRPEGQRGDQAAAVDDAARRHHRDRHRVNDLRNERERAHAGGLGRGALHPRGPMAAGLAPLGHHDVDARGDDRARVLHRRHHRHDLDPRGAAAADEFGTRVAEPDAEDRRPLLEDHFDLRPDDVRDGLGPSRPRWQPEPGAEPVEDGVDSGQPLVGDRRRIDRRPELRVEPQVHPERAIGELPHVLGSAGVARRAARSGPRGCRGRRRATPRRPGPARRYCPSPTGGSGTRCRGGRTARSAGRLACPALPSGPRRPGTGGARGQRHRGGPQNEQRQPDPQDDGPRAK